jgi:hypothetical protein
MANVSLDKEIALDLLNTKINSIVQEINLILSRWKYDDPEKFIHDAKTGVIDEAEDDAIALMNLIDTREYLYNLKRSWGI